jgi:hypothetical protein
MPSAVRMSNPLGNGPHPRTRAKVRSARATALRCILMCVAASLVLAASIEANGRELTSKVTELDRIPAVRPTFPVPNEPDMLFYIQRSVNSNTVIYAAHLDSKGRIDRDTPVNAYWRWYNVDGHKKPLNLIERMMAYGVKSVTRNGPHDAVTFKIAALPERKIVVDLDAHQRPEALTQVGERWIKLDYIYLHVDDSGLLPDVTAMDVFGTDKSTGKAVHAYVIPH